MNKILNFTAIAGAPIERLACGLLDSHCDNGLAVVRTIYDEIKTLHADQHLYIKGGTLGALCVRMNNDAKQIAEINGENEQLKNSYAIASADRVELEKRLNDVKAQLSEWTLWGSRVLGYEGASNERQREEIDRLHVRAGENLKGVREHRDELLQQLANVNMELTACKEEIDELKKSKEQLYALLNKWHEMSSCALLECFNVKCSSIASHEEVMSLLKELTYREAGKRKQNDEHICRLSEEAEELKEDRALASGQLENWRTVTRSILDVHFNCYPVSHIGDKELRDLLAHEVEQLASKHKQLSSDHGALRNAAQSCDLLRRGAELDLADAKACNQRQNETIKKYQADADELKRWQQWALVQFGLHGADQDIRDGVDSFLCSGITDREALRLDLDSVKRHLDHATKQREDILKYRDQFVMDIRNMFKDRLGFDAGCGYKAIAKAIDDMLAQLVHEQTNRCDLAGHLASLFTTGEKAKTWEGIHRSVNLIRKQMDEFGERAEKAGDELEALKKSMMIPAAAGTMDYGSTVIISGQAEPVNVTFKAEQFNIVGGDGERIDLREYGVKVDGSGRVAMGPLDTKITFSPEYKAAIVDAVRETFRNDIQTAIMAAMQSK
ncbi:uncharacterized protein [Enterobacter phage ATCEA85]|nr:uncharacterized protein [Enterobacter phage ATCEA85]